MTKLAFQNGNYLRRKSKFVWTFHDSNDILLFKFKFQAGTLSENIVNVELKKNEWNYIDQNGKFLLDRNVYFAFYFKNGYGIVKHSPDLYNAVDASGKIIFDRPFYFLDFFDGRFFKFQTKSLQKWNFIDPNGKILSERFFLSIIKDFDDDDYAVVQIDMFRFNAIDKNGQLIFKQDFRDIPGVLNAAAQLNDIDFILK